MDSISRRRFLKSGAALAGAISISGWEGIAPQSAGAAESDFLQTSCGAENPAGKKVLVAYASMHGSTGEVAQAIGQVLSNAGASVDIRLVRSVKDLRPYQAVVIGGAVRSDRWLQEAKEFVAGNRAFLSIVPTAYFVTCLTLVRPTEENQKKAQSFLDPVRTEVPEVRPFSTGLFAGVLDLNRYSAAIAAVMRYKMWVGGIEEGDYRNWQAIHAWADQLRSAIFTA
jgi:menaquinone-dependent protoporphyrinogen oxidase